MNMRTYELYNENEYFLKFLKIHPFLTYSNKIVDIKKKEFQINLLNKYNLKEISINDLIKIYNKVIKFELEQKINLDNIISKHKEIISIIQEKNKNELSELYSILI